MGATIGLYFSMSQEGANTLRARLNEIAAGFGYTATRGPTTGRGNLAEMLRAIDAGEVALVLVPDNHQRPLAEFLRRTAAGVRADAGSFQEIGLADSLEVVAEALDAAAERAERGELDEEEKMSTSRWELVERFVAASADMSEVAAMNVDVLAQQIAEMRAAEPDDMPMTDREIAQEILDYAREDMAA